MAKRQLEVDDHGLQQRFARFPRVYRGAVQKTMQASLLKIWELIPPYPPQPANSRYRRTGTLGRTLGSGISGGRQGQPDIMEIKMGARNATGKFGTRLHYAPHVIGMRGKEQKPFFAQYWWTLPDTVLGKAVGPIARLFKVMVEELAGFLERNDA